MPRPIHFEIHAADPERAAKFYADVFDWKIQKWDGPMEYWMIQTGSSAEPGIDGGLMRRMGGEPVDCQAVNAFVCTLDVPQIDAHVEKALAAGAKLALPKMAVPGVGWMAYIQDTEGNILGLMQMDSTAQ